MYIAMCEIDNQSKFNAWNRALKASALEHPRGMGWGGRWGVVQDEGHKCIRGGFMAMYGKTHHNTVK